MGEVVSAVPEGQGGRISPDLAQLRAEAPTDIPPAAPGAEDAAPAAPSSLAQVRGMLEMAVAVGERKWPGVAAVYHDPVKAQVAEVTAAVMDKYGVGMPSWLARWEKEIAFAWVVVPVAAATVGAIIAANKAKLAAEKKPAAEPDGDPEKKERATVPGALKATA